jgi:hypothetical protein
MPPCGPHLTPLATESLERSLLVFSTPGGLNGDDLSRLFFTCTNTSQAATCTCHIYPRMSPHNVVNHSSHQEATIRRSSNQTWSSSCDFLVGLHRRPLHRQPIHAPSNSCSGCVGWFFECGIGRILDSRCRIETVVRFLCMSSGCTTIRLFAAIYHG